MNSLIDFWNMWGGRFVDFALPILWQSSLLMAMVFAFDFLFRHKVRASVRYSLWFVLFVKLLLPPTLALPTGAAWWLRNGPTPVVVAHTHAMTVNYRETVAAYVSPTMPSPPLMLPAPKLSREGWMLVVTALVGVLLAAWILLRWRQISRVVSRTTAASDEVDEILSEVRRLMGLQRNVGLRVTTEPMSPAVCGLFRPVILLPQSLIEKLTNSQLRAVLLHELIHLRRGDVWVNCAQTLLQIVYWWHPLLWIANARVRRVREEAVDDAVMCALSTEAEVYAPTLLEVAKLAFARPLASLGLVGILESRSALRHRIERLMNFTTPRRAGVSVVSVICLAAFTALAVPMGEPPAQSAAATDALGAEKLISYRAKVNTEVFVRNVKARAKESMHASDDDFDVILASIMDEFGVDCTGQRAIRFDPATEEVRTRNTSEALAVLDEVVKELNLKGGERVLNPPPGLKQVLIEGQFYLEKKVPLVKLQLESASFHKNGEMTPWMEVSPADAMSFRKQLDDQGIKPMSSPRIQTSHGITADMSIGDSSNSIQLECLPYVHEGMVSLTVLARTTGSYASGVKSWPEIAGHTNCAIFSQLTITNDGTAILHAAPEGTDTELMVSLTVKILEPATKKVPLLGDLPGVGHLFRSPSNSSAGYEWYKTNFTASASDVAQLVQDGKRLYQLGKLEEATLKLQEALERDPNNRPALYYLSLIKQWQARGNNSVGGARARNVPGPDLRPDSIRVSDAEVQSSAQILHGHTNMIYTNPQRQSIYKKLKDIRFDEIAFTNMSLRDVLPRLAKQTYQSDPDQVGINFILNRTHPKTDSETGAAISQAPPDFDAATVRINVDPALKNVHLLDVLEAITKSADHPISYAILDYGIEFSLKSPEQVQLHTRTFKVDPNTFYMSMQNVIAIAAGKSQNQASKPSNGSANESPSRTEIQIAVIGFFNAMGVNLAAPKSVFFNDRQGTLTVRATDEDLELIEKALNTLNIAPAAVAVKVSEPETEPPIPEVTVKVRFVEVDKQFLKMLSTNGVGTPTSSSQNRILTEEQFKPILKMLQKRDHADLLNEGEVTTLSGRQANFQVVDIETIVSSATNKTPPFETTTSPYGTTLDVITRVATDNRTMDLKVIPCVTEFLGYEDVKTGKLLKTFNATQVVVPESRIRQTAMDTMIVDGETLLLTDFGDEWVIMKPDGPQMRKPFKDKSDKRLVVFITPTPIDKVGNRINGDATQAAVKPAANVQYTSEVMK